ncbi:tryptophan halogenase family protein [Mameliella sediminis]|uniref:tryptophan halogenase family protein n=1 Tax=Mameliella sediminis TaxID=2836866 RepID=UPI001C494867|nr:tryptophan halogenase family protein [Mameliella sediminis]MBV7393205.1 tryptophan 7-halogenase [Mameliella sediminis]
MPDFITKVTIVGGGTAGWMSALILSSLLSRNPETGEKIEITLIESPDIPTVGVGEATVPGMPRTLREAGISEERFMKTCNASFKLGVMFDNWNQHPDGTPIRFATPFERPPTIRGVDMARYFLRYGAGDLEYLHLVAPSLDLRERMRGPRPFRASEYNNDVGFAYHLDAGLFAKMMQEACTERGVIHVMDNLRNVELNEDGFVAALHLEKTGRQEVELVLDCTGFRGLIINQALGGEFVSYSKYLANDRAMAVQVQHPNHLIEPMTRSTALGAGWTWRVPLYNRIGTGYVYSSAHRTDEEARAEFLEWLGPLGKGAEPRVIPMRIGRNKEQWVKNCVAVGLSSGFIEPLESTAIHMIEMTARMLATYFPDKSYDPALRGRFNKQMRKMYDEVRDFICFHYALGNRTDSPYWIDAREALETPDSLAENLDLWRHVLPGPYDLEFSSLFSHYLYQAVLVGKRVYETDYAAPNFNRGIELDENAWWDYVAQMRARFDGFIERAADHRLLLRDMRGDLTRREIRHIERGELDPATLYAGAQTQPASASSLL